MRTIILIVLMAVVTGLKAQSLYPGGFINNNYSGIFNKNFHDSSYQKKWSVTRFTAVSASYAFFRGGSASIFSVPIVLQLNRRLNNNLYAFASVSVEPAYVNFNRTFVNNSFSKQNQNNLFYRPGNLDLYSRAQLGLQYINDDRTFSISGSIGIERGSYPFPQYNQTNSTNTNRIVSPNSR